MPVLRIKLQEDGRLSRGTTSFYRHLAMNGLNGRGKSGAICISSTAFAMPYLNNGRNPLRFSGLRPPSQCSRSVIQPGVPNRLAPNGGISA